MDEVGRGAWAGPLAVGAAILPAGRRVKGVRDSKALTERKREELFDRVASWCVAWSVGFASPAECDTVGMAEAQRRAALRALEGLGVDVDHALVDGPWDFVRVVPTTTIVKGDVTCLSIAAASILAKVSRDRIMRAAAVDYPPYEFDSNKGYPCSRHTMALVAYGPSAIHRRSWAFMERLGLSGGSLSLKARSSGL
jgi:ribonuclease HII